MTNQIKINKNTVVKKKSFYSLAEAELWIGDLPALIEECGPKADNLHFSVYYKVTVYIND